MQRTWKRPRILVLQEKYEWADQQREKALEQRDGRRMMRAANLEMGRHRQIMEVVGNEVTLFRS
jgi:hypothetical protein